VEPGQLQRIDTTETVDTPERVDFRFRLAGPGQRAAAYAIDLVLQMMIVAAAAIFAALLSVLPAGSEMGMGMVLLVMFITSWLYGAAFETALGGRTPGKWALELRVVKVDGAPARFPDFLLRNLVRAADMLPVLQVNLVPVYTFGLGVLVMAFDPKMRRLGDWVAGTVVIAENKWSMLESVRIEPPVSEEERRALPPRVDLRPEELEVIEAFLRRRRSLSPERADELASHFAPALRRRTGIEASSDERVLALAYARATGKDRETAGGRR
jgi:uncharacterized RDD family membrane protein YckC